MANVRSFYAQTEKQTEEQRQTHNQTTKRQDKNYMTLMYQFGGIERYMYLNIKTILWLNMT